MNKIIVRGKAQGQVLYSKNPINFLGAVDKISGEIRDEKHDLFRKSIKDCILIFPHGIGSSVGAYTIYSLKKSNSSPKAMICQKADLTVATGCALANIPLVIISEKDLQHLTDKKEIKIDTDLTNPIVTL